MYTDTILFIIGVVCALLTLLLVGYLMSSSRKSRSYYAILQQETELFDTLTTTALLAGSAKSNIHIVDADDETEFLAGKSQMKCGTSLIFEDDRTELLKDEQSERIPFDDSALEGRYVLKNEIYGGGMSRVFLAESTKLGNQWIVKFISNQTGELANEENILKLLNHISLPKIIDIFHDEKGVYLVESYIEGVSLDTVFESGQKINQVIILEWAEQLAQVLSYLHRMKPHPIYHFDLKPSNIMVTHDNRLVLIDFGISKRFGKDDATVLGVTYQYAAPEQLKNHIPDKHMSVIKSRFGELPADRLCWNPDARTDIYSLGGILFELAVGGIPTAQNMNTLEDMVSHELYTIIIKCLAINPDNRYQSAEELLFDLQKVKGSKVKMARTLFIRKLASVSCVFTVLVSGGSLSGGYYIYAQENMALLDVEPEILTISLQQSSALSVEKQMPDGSIVMLDNSEIKWTQSQDNIAQIDGNRISGMNLGEAELSGKYRNKSISLNVRVVEPMEGMVDISQRYQIGHFAEIFAGTTERDHIDGMLAEADFVSPESIDIADDGTIYISDSGLLRKIKDGKVDSINFEPDFLTANVVRCYKNQVYILTHQWEDDDGVYYGIIKLTDEGAEGLYISDAQFTAIEDFAVGGDELIYFIDRNEGVDSVSLKTLNTKYADNIEILCELPKGTSALTMDENDNVYLANPETGVLQVWRDGELAFFAGIENEKAFVDGAAPLFYMPQKVKYSNDSLYVWDFNVLRCVNISDSGLVEECMTVAGEANPTFDLDIMQTKQPAEEIILPNSRVMDLVVKDDGILLTDPRHGIVWWIE